MRARGSERGGGSSRGQHYRNAHGIFIGVDQTPAIPTDLGAANDVSALSVALEPALRTNVRVVGEDGTRRGILSRLEDVVQSAGPDDLVIVYLSGNGMAKYDDVYFLPWEFDPDSFLATSVSFRLISAVLGAAPGVKSLMIVDTCYAGSVGFDMSRYRSGSESSLMVSCGPEEMAMSKQVDGVEHGLFSASLVSALNEQQESMGKAWTVPVIDWFDGAYVQTLAGGDNRQHPVFLGTLSPNLKLRARRSPSDRGTPNPSELARGREE